jgi:type VI secretion system protein ImpG
VVSDELLPYYNRELAYIRGLGAEFAGKYPKIASRLRLTAEGSADPHVERIIEGFAYLNARIRHKLDDDFPEITDALLSVLYPHYQRPIPSMAVVQFGLDRSQGELVAGHEVPRGTPIETEYVQGESCRYQTAYDAKLWPFELASATLAGRPFAAPQTSRSAHAKSVLHLSLATFQPAVHFKHMSCDRLRFFLHAAQGQNIHGLYELLLHHAIEVAFARSAQDPQPAVLAKTCLQPVGFGPEHALLPYTAQMFSGYRLLSEYFVFPEKFLFVDLVGLTPQGLSKVDDRLEVYVFLDRSIPDLERTVSRDTFRFGCTPIVNLFRQRADPFVLTHTETEYYVSPDARRKAALEVYSIDRVRATSPQGEVVEYRPFYSFKHGGDAQQQTRFWHAVRRTDPADESNDQWRAGTEVYLSFVDLNFTPATSPEWTVDIESTCTNRNLPGLLPFGGGRPELDLPEGRGVVAQIRCLTPPTHTIRPPLKHRALWKVISHLSLNHLSLSDSLEGADALREILRIYDLTDSPVTHDLLEGIDSVAARRIVGRAPGLRGAFCRGMETRITLDDDKFQGSGAYLFASVIDRFLSLYVSINSFSKLVATTKQRAQQQEPWQWPARAGEQVIL